MMYRHRWRRYPKPMTRVWTKDFELIDTAYGHQESWLAMLRRNARFIRSLHKRSRT